MTRSNQFDNLNRLTNLVWNVAGSNVASFAYQYNSANQRTRATLADGSYWLYQYDALGQVTSAKRYWSDGTPVAGQQSTFTFDDIGNRKVTTSGGDQTGANLRSANYSANTVNQITSRDVPGYVNILGTATNAATVSLWSKESTALYTPTSRKGDYFRGELPLNNSTGAVWLTITNVAVLSNYAGADIVTNTVGKVFVPKTAEAFSYDLDGNLTNDGRWFYTWDAENRVTSFTRNSAAPAGSRVRLDCQYDSKSRRTQKIVSAWNGLTYQPTITNKFVYDGWNLIAILDATNGLVQSFTWGKDASGSMQGAGGVGGLISMTVHQGTNVGTYFYCFDGNHNVTALVNATNGVVAAQYEFDAFGNPLRATGPLAFVNPFTFSTKFCDWETGFLYYGYRYCDPDTGRWLGRDPLEEAGGKNIFCFVANNPLTHVDPYGLTLVSLAVDCGKELIKKGVVEGMSKWWDKTMACTEIAQKLNYDPESQDNHMFCKGGKKWVIDMKPTYEEQPLGSLILGCLLSKVINEGGWEKMIKKTRDPEEQKLLKKLMEKAAEIADAAKDVTAEPRMTINARCDEKWQFRVTLNNETKITVGDYSAVLKDKVLEDFTCTHNQIASGNAFKDPCGCCRPTEKKKRK